MAKAGNQGLVRINNQNAILEYVRDHGPLSRADLSKCLKISKPTVSTNVESLVERGILLEVGPGETSVGKKPTLLEFNKNHKLILALDLSREEGILAIGNLEGTVLGQIPLSLSTNNSNSDRKTSILESLDKLFLEVGHSKSKVDQIVIASPGIFSKEETRQWVNPQFEHLQAMQLNVLLEEYFGVKPKIRNDINMAALGEKFFGNGINHSDLAYISVGLGVGGGLIINNELYLGSRRAAGEIGFVASLNVRNNMGHYMSLENTIGEGAIEKRLFLESALHPESLVFLKTRQPDYATFVEAVKKDDAYCKTIAMEIIDHLALAIGNLSVVLDFELVIVGGRILSLGTDYIKVLEERVNRLTPLKTEIKPSKLMSAEIYGALKVGMDAVFDNLVPY